MKTLRTTVLMGALACSVLLLTGGTASAQSKTLQGDSETVTVTIEAIDLTSRTMTVKDSKGIYETVDVPPEITRFSELKVGDKITARYYENVVVRLKKPGEAAVDVDSDAVTRGQGRPGGTAATQRTITVTVTAMDPKAKSVTVKSASPGRKGRGDSGSEANLHKRVDSERIAQHIAAFEKSGGRVEKLGVTRVLQKVSEVAATAPAQASKSGGRRR